MQVGVGDIVDGRYILLEKLGEGAAGKVFRAEDRGRGHGFVALKVLHAQDPRWLGFFRREFEVLSQLSHPNIVSAYDFGVLDGDEAYYFSQELVIGRPLLDVSAGARLTYVVELFIELMRALEFIHGHDVLHRDIKPANVLVHQYAPRGYRVKLLDFGLWQERDDKEVRGARWAGTPPYLASEVLKGYGHSIAADIFAVGVTLYQAITRKLPHGRGKPEELIQVRKEPLKPWGDYIPLRLKNLVERMIDDDPKRRPASAAEVSAGLIDSLNSSTGAVPTLLGHARMVDRARELERARSFFDDVEADLSEQPQLMHIRGEDGSGKSRLARELQAQAQLRGHKCALISCGLFGASNYRAAFEVLTQLDPDWVARMNERPLTPSQKPLSPLPESDFALSRKSENVERTEHIDVQPQTGFFALDSESSTQLYLAFVERIRRLSERRPVVIILDDFELAHQDFTTALKSLVHEKGQGRFALITLGGRSLSSVANTLALGDLQRRMDDEASLALGTLSRSGISTMVSAILGRTQIPSLWVDVVSTYSESNPRRVEDLLQTMVARNLLKRDRTGWTLEKDENPWLKPRPMEALIDESLDALKPNELKLLRLMAISQRPLGLSFAKRCLTRLALPMQTSEVRELAHRLEEAGLIRSEIEMQQDILRFKHAAFRHSLMQRMRAGEIRKLHRVIAETLETLSKRFPAVVETLSYHWLEAGVRTKALAACSSALEQRLHRGHLPQSLEFVRKRQRLMNQFPRQRDVHVRDGDALVLNALSISGHAQSALDFATRALLRQPQARDSMTRNDYALWYRAFEVAGCVGRLQPLWDMGQRLGLLSGENHKSGDILSEVDGLRAMVFNRVAPNDALRTIYQLHLSDTHPEKDELYFERARWVTRLSHASGELETSRKLARILARECEEEGREHELPLALIWESHTLESVGKRFMARQRLRLALEAAQAMRHTLALALYEQELAWQMARTGAFGPALARMQGAVVQLAELGRSLERTQALIQVGRIYAQSGETKRSIDHLLHAKAATDRLGDIDSMISVRASLSEVYVDTGYDQGAMHELDEASSLLRPTLGPATLIGWANSAAKVLTRRDEDHPHLLREMLLRALAYARQAGDWYNEVGCAERFAEFALRQGMHPRGLRVAKWALERARMHDADGAQKRLEPVIAALSAEPKKGGINASRD